MAFRIAFLLVAIASIFSVLITPIQAWTTGDTGSNAAGGVMGRRDVIGKLSTVVGASQLLVPGMAIAQEDTDSFSTYNIIPDDSAKLDPRLVKLDVSDMTVL